MKNQQGAALVIVMALLSGALLIGISGMNSALIDERLAGNYRAVALAQMNAERAASEADTHFNDENDWKYKPNSALSSEDDWKATIKSQRYEELKENYPEDMVKEGICDSSEDNYSRCLYFPVVVDGSVYYIVALGAVEDEAGNTIAESEPIFLRYDYSPGDGLSPINDFLDKLKNSGNAITTFIDRYLETSGNATAKGWDDFITNVVGEDGENPIFDSADVFLEFIDILKEDESVNYFDYFPSGKKLEDYSNSIIVVENDFTWNGNQGDFTGVLILLGDVFEYNGGGNSKFRGSLMHVPYAKNSDNEVEFVQPKISVKGGNGNLEFDATVIDGLKNNDVEGSGENFDIQNWEWE